MTESRDKITSIINRLTHVGLEAVDEIERLRARIIELERERDAAYKVVDENWVTHQRVVAADARITELELDLVRLRTLHDCERARAERLEAAIRDMALPAIHDACCSVAIYGDQPPKMYTVAFDKLRAALEDKP